MLAGMLGLHGIGSAPPAGAIVQLTILFAIVWACPDTQQIMSRFEPALGRPVSNPYPRLIWQPDLRWALALGAVAALALGGTTEFLYFQF